MLTHFIPIRAKYLHLRFVADHSRRSLLTYEMYISSPPLSQMFSSSMRFFAFGVTKTLALMIFIICCLATDSGRMTECESAAALEPSDEANALKLIGSKLLTNWDFKEVNCDQNLLPGAIVGGSDAHSFADHKDNSEQFDPLHITQCPDSWRSTMKKAIANIDKNSSAFREVPIVIMSAENILIHIDR
ncbi:hypothetical protein Tco_1430556 [Tanacetum coccineum]